MLKNLILILSAVYMLQGCASDGETRKDTRNTGGFFVGKDNRKFGTIMEDAAITTSINSKFLTAKGVSTFDINVDTFKGIVTLSGKVPSGKIKRKVIRLSKKVDGVRRVISKLRIKK